MNKSAIQKFAVWARRELINGVTLRARRYGITAENTGNEADKIVNGQVLTNAEMAQRKGLIRAVKERGFQSVMDEAAYTWFNRFIALRYMEVNDYLPSHIRVFTNSAGEFKPEILKEAMNVDLPGLDLQQVMRCIERNENENLYRMLLLAQCNAMNELLPYLFEPMEGWTALLLPDNILQENSVPGRMITDIPEEDWKEQVQIVGWLYQYYNTEPKADVFAGLKKNIKINKDTIPAATQLFTPDWIVRYMVENSLGRLWLEHLQAQNEAGMQNLSAEQSLKKNWKYYLNEAEQELEVEAQLKEIRKERLNLRLEEIRCIDPCMGSGHILVYAFDVLMQIYLQAGWTERDAAQSILKNNLYGIDIDKRAAQLAYFAVMMKARQYDRRILTRGITPNLCAIVESNGLSTFEVPNDQPNFSEQAVLTANYLIQTFTNARELGSIINVEPYDYDHLLGELESWSNHNKDLIVNAWYEQVKYVIPSLIRQAKLLSHKYDVVVTNPPYMGFVSMGKPLLEYVRDKYPDSKTDLFAVFIEKCKDLLVRNGYNSMITQQNWMFYSSFTELRQRILQQTLINLIHLGSRAFDEISGEVVQTVTFVYTNNVVDKYKGTYFRAVTGKSELEKEIMYLEHKNKFVTEQTIFSRLPNKVVAYWINNKTIDSFNNKKTSEFIETREGMATADNEKFLRLWFEPQEKSINFSCKSISESIICGKKWFPYNKGGETRRWFGNNDYVVNWENDGYEIKNNIDPLTKRIRSHNYNGDYAFKKGFTWTAISSDSISLRFNNYGFLFDSKGPKGFANDENNLLYFIALINSKVTSIYLSFLSPTMGFKVGDLLQIPVYEESIGDTRINQLSNDCISISKSDWDSFETSWDFSEHPMVYFSQGLWDVTAIMCTIHSFFGRNITVNSPIEASWWLWKAECEERFQKLKANEEELNRIFINIYGLQDELTPEVSDDDVTVHKADLKRDIKSLISYAVGCMFGRYSLVKEGLIFAGGNFDEMFSKRKEYLAMDYYDPNEPPSEDYICLKTKGNNIQLTYSPDKDNILPICDDEYFEDDIVGRFVKWVETVYGADKLEENLKFIADALGGNGTSRQIIRRYFLNDFFKDHCSTYSVTGSGKRPIYWLFDAGKKNSFKALIYMHRYEPNLISKLRTDYVHIQQQRLETRIAQTDEMLTSETRPAARKQLNDQLKNLREQETELRKFEEKIHHLADQRITIDLDDGVKVNHAKFGDVLAPIK